MKGTTGKQAGELHPIPPGKRPFEVIYIDHLGPFVKSKKRHSHLFVTIDNLTRFVRLYPTRSTKSVETISALEIFVLEHGIPRRIVSDRGTCFTSGEFEEFCTCHGVLHTLNSPRHPQANGMVERVNRTVVPVIAV